MQLAKAYGEEDWFYRDIILLPDFICRFIDAGAEATGFTPPAKEWQVEEMNDNVTYETRIRRKLADTFRPLALEIVDDSARHAGHAGHDPRGETHFRLRIVSEVFTGLGRIARHRLVYETLAEELQERVHAVNIEALAPEEYNLKL